MISWFITCFNYRIAIARSTVDIVGWVTKADSTHIGRIRQCLMRLDLRCPNMFKRSCFAGHLRSWSPWKVMFSEEAWWIPFLVASGYIITSHLGAKSHWFWVLTNMYFFSLLKSPFFDCNFILIQSRLDPLIYFSNLLLKYPWYVSSWRHTVRSI